MQTNQNHPAGQSQIAGQAEDIERLEALADHIHNTAAATDVDLGLDEMVDRLDAHIESGRRLLAEQVPADLSEIAAYSINLHALIACEEAPDLIEASLRRLALAANALHQQFQAERYQPAVAAAFA